MGPTGAGRKVARKKPAKASARNRSSIGSASLPIPSARYLFFGGKGGVGKTTAAAATALRLIDQAQAGERILLFSTDPAHSLSDSLEIKIGDRPVKLASARGARLIGREMDGRAALAKFKKRYDSVLALIAERGTLLDESDIGQLLNLSLPGLDEVMALFELSEIERENDYSRIIIDTAPTGHAMRLLQLPEAFAGWVSALDRMQDKHRYMIARLAGGRQKPYDEAELFLRDMAERITRVRALLYDPERTAFIMVTIPEGMVFEETRRYFDSLAGQGVSVSKLIVNRVEREHGRCAYCRARVAAQKPWLDRIAREFSDLEIRTVPLMAEEARGPDKLRRFADLMWRSSDKDADRRKIARAPASLRSRLTTAETIHQVSEIEQSGFELAARRLLIFGGKGGVGKTTAAAAAALALAESDKRARVLVLSIDPAHSLSDSFDERIGELKRNIAGCKNLDAMEVNPAARFEEIKSRYRRWTDELFESLSAESGWRIEFEHEALEEALSLAPPGIDEIVALGAISELTDEDRYTAIVLDTAPTGHLIRFLELPEIALSWVHTLMKLVLKYKEIIDWSGMGEQLIALSKNIKRISDLFTDANECEFIGVAVAERMSLMETAGLTETLKRLKVPMRRLLINNVAPEGAASACDFCATRRREQESVLEDFQGRFARKLRLFIAPQQPEEVRGRKRLREHFAQWRPIVKQYGGRRGR